MMKALCCGVLPLRQKESLEVLLVFHRKGEYWGFPKGHVKEGEELHQAAKRELLEETGLEVESFAPALRFEEEYCFTKDGKEIEKKVIYFAAWAKGEISLQKKEILKANWFALPEALQTLSFEGTKSICRKLIEAKLRH